MNMYSLGRAFFCVAVAVTTTTRAAEAPAEQPAPTASTNVSLSVSPASRRAPWQEHLTLGPGDTLNISLLIFAPGAAPNATLFNATEARTDVPIGPDGRITFLQARDVPAAGLTVDELRAKLDESLSTYYQNPRTIVVPSAIRSKKYVVLGAVANRGVYPFDRPVTIIEAIARAGGLQTGLYEDRAVEMADLQHSFLARNGQRVPLDFERLFQHGDLSQNLPLQPDDYLYFASANSNEIYVLGEVNNPGVLVFAPNPTAMNAIASRGGFTEKAYRRRILVIRGSLNNPQTFVVEAANVLGGKASDLKLQPKDIVFVSESAWIKAQDVLDTAARAFIQGALVTLTTRNVGPLFPRISIHTH